MLAYSPILHGSYESVVLVKNLNSAEYEHFGLWLDVFSHKFDHQSCLRHPSHYRLISAGAYDAIQHE